MCMVGVVGREWGSVYRFARFLARNDKPESAHFFFDAGAAAGASMR
jgi:hypothetical protein